MRGGGGNEQRNTGGVDGVKWRCSEEVKVRHRDREAVVLSATKLQWTRCRECVLHEGILVTVLMLIAPLLTCHRRSNVTFGLPHTTQSTSHVPILLYDILSPYP